MLTICFVSIPAIVLVATAHASTPTPSTIFGTSLPTETDHGDGRAIELGVKFTTSEPGTITGIRYYKSAKNTGTHTGSLWSASGKLLAQATFTTETTSGWQNVTFAQPVAVTAGTTYVAGYYAPKGHYAVTSEGLNSSVSNGPLTAVGNNVSTDGLYALSNSSTFPNMGYQADNFYVDVDFIPSSTSPSTTTTSGTSGTSVSGVSGSTRTSGKAGTSSGTSGTPTTPSTTPTTTTTSTTPTTTTTSTTPTTTTTTTTSTTPTTTTTSTTPTTTTTPTNVMCNLNATTSNFTAQVAAATPGQTVCLAAGNYGNWAGTSKAAPGITITTQPGAAVTMGFNFYLPNTQNFTVDGGANGGSISTPNGGQSFEGNSTTARNITIQNVSFVGKAINVDIDGPANSNITFNHDLFSGSDCMTAGSGVAIHLSYSGSAPSGVTVENSTIENGSSDGIQSGTAMTILNNYFYNLIETSAEMQECHTDAIQFYGMTGGQTVIEGNWFVNTSDGIGSWNGDNAPGYIIENNVFDHQTEESAIALHLDNGSTVEHNTCIDPGAACLDLTGLSGTPSVGTVVKDNVFDAKYAYDLSNADPASLVDNMDSNGTSGQDFAGTPVFAGGLSFPLSSFDSYLLAAGSAGKGRADDGTDVGVTGLPVVAYGPQAQ